MKTKLYRKVLKMAKHEFFTDDQPLKDEVEHAFTHYLTPDTRFLNSFKFFINGTAYSSESERAAWLGYLVWNWKSMTGESRYSLKRNIEEKFKHRSRKYWEADKVLLRAIESGS